MAAEARPTIEAEARPVRSAEVPRALLHLVADGIEQIASDRLDMLVVRDALPVAALAEAAGRLQGDMASEWERPNKILPDEAIELVGLPGTPTATMPQGPPLDAYLSSSDRQRDLLARLFPDLDPVAEVEDLFRQISGQRPVGLLSASGGRTFSPLNIRSLANGHGLTTHMDDHYHLSMYRDLNEPVDAGLTISFITPLQLPDSGGDLLIYGVTRAGRVLRLPTGRYDAKAVDQGYVSTRFDLRVGDLAVFCGFHKVTPVVGSRRRITMGGFLSFSPAKDQVLYWS